MKPNVQSPKLKMEIFFLFIGMNVTQWDSHEGYSHQVLMSNTHHSIKSFQSILTLFLSYIFKS